MTHRGVFIEGQYEGKRVDEVTDLKYLCKAVGMLTDKRLDDEIIYQQIEILLAKRRRMI